jgi:signal transduction histidine kinase
MVIEMKPSIKKPVILIVDDVPDNLQVLAGHLVKAGLEVISSSSGERALEILKRTPVDLVLLDIMMPGMDGFEVCREIKNDARTSEIPVIFITARADSDDVISGFQLGAVDYVTKPFKLLELLARVRTHLDLKQARDDVLKANERLLRANEEKNRFIGVVSHDIRGFCGNVVSVSKLATEGIGLHPLEEAELLRALGLEAEHMLTLAENLLNVDAIESGELKLNVRELPLENVFAFAKESLELAARAKEIGVNILPLPDGLKVRADPTALRQVIQNFLSNAIKFSPRGSTIELGASVNAGGWVRISVRDEGSGLGQEQQRQLFQPYQRLHPSSRGPEHSAGLGLSIARTISESMGGRVGCESEPGKGALFFVELPGTTLGSLPNV